MSEDKKQEQEQENQEASAQAEAEVEVTEESTEETTSEESAEAVDAQTEEEVRVAVDEDEVATFSGDLDGKVYTMDELQAASEDYSDDEFHELVDMYEDTLHDIEEKEVVKGRVVSVDEKYVVVDIGFKSEGIIQKNEFPNEVAEKLEPGDEVEVFLDRVEDREGQLILSRRKADILHAWEKIESSYYNEEVLEGYIHRRIKGGMVVDIMGIDAFLPGSQIDVRPVRDFDAYVGKTMEFKVVKLNMQAENVVVSHRALIESDLEEQREEILATIEAGQVLEGSVKNITDFGVFIDLGGVDGLLHITDLSWGRVEHPSEIVSLDQRMNVAVIDFDEETKRVSLGLKQLQPHPWDEIGDKYPEGTRVQGRVVSIADYGAFIELEKGVEGLIHISEMSWTQHIKHPSQLVDKDDIIECVVLNVNKDEKKISLGVKQLEKDPWEDLTDRYPVGSKHTGKVRNLTNFGVFVELEPGIDGLVHISDLSWTEKINHPSEMVEKGDDMEVVILAVDFNNRRITLGHKQIEDNPWEKFAVEYAVGNEVKGTIKKVTDKGVFIELPLGAEAFLPGSKTDTEGEFTEDLNEGDEIEATVIEFDESSKNITLTQREQDVKRSVRKTKKSDKKQREKPAETGTPTLGEMSGLSDLKRKLQEKEQAAAAAQQAEAEAADASDDSDEESDNEDDASSEEE
ncbi:MAG: 30S ribosomal protein S1 [Bacteroidota bacterium]